VDSPYIYLDHAAATPLDDRVLAAMQPFFAEQFYNPSSPYVPAVTVRRAFEGAKHRLASAIGAKPDELVVTAGATESINLIVAATSGHIVSSAIEHPAVLESIKARTHDIVRPTEKGIILPEAVAAAIRPDTELVSIQLANNEIGTIQPLREIASIVRIERARRAEVGDLTPIYFHSDASQGIGQIDCHVARLGVDALTLNAGKIYGPKQVGLLWAASHVKLSPLITGGGQERGLRSGTENVAGTVGFARALELAMEHRGGESKRLSGLRDQLQRQLVDAFPDVVISGHPKKRLPGHLHISFPGLDAERLLFMLESKGVLVATGSACAANKGTRSHVLTAIGLSPEIADGSIRITLGRLSNDTNIAHVFGIIKDVIMTEKARVSQ
jgi:cysteine desulfurase